MNRPNNKIKLLLYPFAIGERKYPLLFETNEAGNNYY